MPCWYDFVCSFCDATHRLIRFSGAGNGKRRQHRPSVGLDHPDLRRSLARPRLVGQECFVGSLQPK